MSFKSREKKRRRKAALGNLRARHGNAMKGRHYLTIITRDCCCNYCGAALRRGQKDRAVFRYEPRDFLSGGQEETFNPSAATKASGWGEAFVKSAGFQRSLTRISAVSGTRPVRSRSVPTSRELSLRAARVPVSSRFPRWFPVSSRSCSSPFP